MDLKEITVKVGDKVYNKRQKSIIWTVISFDSYKVELEWQGNLATRIRITWAIFHQELQRGTLIEALYGG